jgi:hypothetical protein
MERVLRDSIQKYHPCLYNNREEVERIAQEFIEASPNSPGPDSVFSEYEHPVCKDKQRSQLDVLHLRCITRELTCPEGSSEFYSTIKDQIRALQTATRDIPEWGDVVFVHHKNCRCPECVPNGDSSDRKMLRGMYTKEC